MGGFASLTYFCCGLMLSISLLLSIIKEVYQVWDLLVVV